MRFNRSFALVVILFVLLGVAIIDGSSILFGKWQLSDAADAAAFDAAISYSNDGDLDGAKVIAQGVVDSRLEGAKVTKVTADEEGAVTVIVTKDASTIFVKRVSAVESWGQLRVEATASRPST